MNKKVTLKEIVWSKMVCAALLASYYWTWARTDWKGYYQTIQTVLIACFTVYFLIMAGRIRKYKKEGIDEMAEQNLKRCDSVCLKLFLAAMIVTAWIGAVSSHVSNGGASLVGGMIMMSVLALSVIRTVMFAVMDSKGL